MGKYGVAKQAMVMVEWFGSDGCGEQVNFSVGQTMMVWAAGGGSRLMLGDGRWLFLVVNGEGRSGLWCRASVVIDAALAKQQTTSSTVVMVWAGGEGSWLWLMMVGVGRSSWWWSGSVGEAAVDGDEGWRDGLARRNKAVVQEGRMRASR
ncbi:hypothetical protein Dimus_016649 [Dionaea muscipula]